MPNYWQTASFRVSLYVSGSVDQVVLDQQIDCLTR